MKRIIGLLVLIGAVAWNYWHDQANSTTSLETSQTQQIDTVAAETQIRQAFAEQRSNVMVEGQGKVVKVLPDDNKGSKHQRFILLLSDGHTLLVAHNIDLAPRLPNLKKGDTVGFKGEYEWSPKGGVLHWTHHDPQGRHDDGWLMYHQRMYQ